ncbi:frataxin, mitochondrial isoform X2 [Larimichthys crocea]|uniref:frataxin, mitochondrial isoform X2 n=1 Tax=Larimichthys crocea TaxID=215358 RepID=UPI000F5EF4F1|nr:frataxin, mitochondrial isoform X2 [Larimichthys crocea]
MSVFTKIPCVYLTYTQITMTTSRLLHHVRSLSHVTGIRPYTIHTLHPVCQPPHTWFKSKDDCDRWRKNIHLTSLQQEKATPVQISELSESEYEKLADVTLDALADYFEDLTDEAFTGAEYDVVFSVFLLTAEVASDFLGHFFTQKLVIDVFVSPLLKVIKAVESDQRACSHYLTILISKGTLYCTSCLQTI